MSLITDCADNTKKICIQAKRVFDACRKQLSLENQNIIVNGASPSGPTLPLNYVGAQSSSTRASLENLVITPLECGTMARYRGNAVIPLNVSYKDAADISGTGASSLTVPFDIALGLPQGSIMPYTLEGAVSARSTIGAYTGSDVGGYGFRIDICVLLILKIVMEADILIPTYGYAVIPECSDFGDRVCDLFFAQPIFPE